MNKQLAPILFLGAILLASCSGYEGLSVYDDVYQEKREIEAMPVLSETETPTEERIVDAYEYYEDDDYYFSNRIRRFHRPSVPFSYYAPYYTNASVGLFPQVNWGVYGGWGAGYNYAPSFYGQVGFGPMNYFPVYSPYAYQGYYSPWLAYDPYCPSYFGSPYYGLNEVYVQGRPVYMGQYKRMGTGSRSSTTSLRKANDTRPAYRTGRKISGNQSSREASQSRPEQRHDARDTQSSSEKESTGRKERVETRPRKREESKPTNIEWGRRDTGSSTRPNRTEPSRNSGTRPSRGTRNGGRR